MYTVGNAYYRPKKRPALIKAILFVLAFAVLQSVVVFVEGGVW